MSKLNLQDILRASHVKRWTIVNTANIQTLAQHTFNVVMIARAIAKEFGHPDDRVIKMALEHDLDEVVTGDIPTPTKQRLLSMGVEADRIWPHAKKNVGESIEQKIVKMADLIEAYLFIRDNGVGRHAKQVEKEVFDAMNDYMRESFGSNERKILHYEILDPLVQGEFII